MSSFKIIETVPSDLNFKPQYSTGKVLIDEINNSKDSIYLTAMYWSLIACPPENISDYKKTPIPYGNKCPQDPSFTPSKLQSLGSDIGRELFCALRDSIIRGVNVYIISGRGFGGVSEDKILQQAVSPNPKGSIHLYDINTLNWWGGGIFHQKLWVFDKKSIYVGSANMDWKSLAQVKELGIIVNNTDMSQDLLNYWKTWQELSELSSTKYSMQFLDPIYGVNRNAPSWSPDIPQKKLPSTPLLSSGSKYNTENPYSGSSNQIGNSFISGCPISMCVPYTKNNGGMRTYDQDGIIYTIRQAKKTVCISVMDFCPTSIYFPEFQIWWSSFYDAILNAVITRKLDVKILYSNWAYSPHNEEGYFKSLLSLVKNCKIAQNDGNWSGSAGDGKVNCDVTPSPCFPGKISCGNLEIKYIEIPGWDKTSGKNPEYTNHSRVNHTKYLVTDNRINIGTSNWTWGYFYNTAGSSFNSDNKSMVKTLQNIFNRDWNSKYSNLIENLSLIENFQNVTKNSENYNKILLPVLIVVCVCLFFTIILLIIALK